MTWNDIKAEVLKMDADQLRQRVYVHDSWGFHGQPDRIKKSRADMYSIGEEGDPLFTKTQGIKERGIDPAAFDYIEDEWFHLAIPKGALVLEID